MTSPEQENQVQTAQPSDKELNFRALEAKYERQLEQERQARIEAEKKAEEILRQKQMQHEDDEADDEPYVDHRKLEKKLSRFGQSTQSEIQKAMEQAKVAAKEELKQELWLEKNPDFYNVMQNAQKLYDNDPELGETILKMPNNFERQKLVYKNIKALGLDKPAQKQSSVQDKVNANLRSPYYQPSGIATAPYSTSGDFSSSGQKQAYSKMKELQSRLRI